MRSTISFVHLFYDYFFFFVATDPVPAVIPWPQLAGFSRGSSALRQ